MEQVVSVEVTSVLVVVVQVVLMEVSEVVVVVT